MVKGTHRPRVKRVQVDQNKLVDVKLYRRGEEQQPCSVVTLHKGLFSVARKNLDVGGEAEISDVDGIKVVYRAEADAIKLEMSVGGDTSLCTMRLQNNVCHVNTHSALKIRGLQAIATHVLKRKQVLEASRDYGTSLPGFASLEECVKTISGWGLEMQQIKSMEKANTIKELGLIKICEDQVTAPSDSTTLSFNVGVEAFKDLMFFNSKLVSRLHSHNVLCPSTRSLDTARHQVLGAAMACQLPGPFERNEVMLTAVMQKALLSDVAMQALMSCTGAEHKPVTRLSMRVKRGDTVMVEKVPVYALTPEATATLGIQLMRADQDHAFKSKPSTIYVIAHDGKTLILNHMDYHNLNTTPSTVCDFTAPGAEGLLARRRYVHAACCVHAELSRVKNILTRACLDASGLSPDERAQFNTEGVSALDMMCSGSTAMV